MEAKAQPKQEYVIAMYAYDKQHPDDISFQQGDRIKVLEKHQTGWWTGEIKGTDGETQIGNFPSNFVRVEEPRDPMLNSDPFSTLVRAFVQKDFLEIKVSKKYQIKASISSARVGEGIRGQVEIQMLGNKPVWMKSLRLTLVQKDFIHYPGRPLFPNSSLPNRGKGFRRKPKPGFYGYSQGIYPRTKNKYTLQRLVLLQRETKLEDLYTHKIPFRFANLRASSPPSMEWRLNGECVFYNKYFIKIAASEGIFRTKSALREVYVQPLVHSCDSKFNPKVEKSVDLVCCCPCWESVEEGDITDFPGYLGCCSCCLKFCICNTGSCQVNMKLSRSLFVRGDSYMGTILSVTLNNDSSTHIRQVQADIRVSVTYGPDISRLGILRVVSALSNEYPVGIPGGEELKIRIPLLKFEKYHPISFSNGLGKKGPLEVAYHVRVTLFSNTAKPAYVYFPITVIDSMNAPDGVSSGGDQKRLELRSYNENNHISGIEQKAAHSIIEEQPESAYDKSRSDEDSDDNPD